MPRPGRVTHLTARRDPALISHPSRAHSQLASRYRREATFHGAIDQGSETNLASEGPPAPRPQLLRAGSLRRDDPPGTSGGAPFAHVEDRDRRRAGDDLRLLGGAKSP